MLAGVGGRTVAEAKQNLSYAEYHSWLRMRAKWGPLLPSRQLEQTIGRLTYITALVAGNKKAEPHDFMPWEKANYKPAPVAAPKQQSAADVRSIMSRMR